MKDDADAEQWAAVEEATELIQEERYQDALYALRDVVKADPTNAYAYHFMGVALYEVGQMQPARDAFRVAVKLAPSYLGARTHLAQTLRKLGEHRAAIREGMEALRLAPADGDALHAVGMAHVGLGNRTEGRRYLEAFLDTKPEFEIATEVRQIIEMIRLAEGPMDIDDS